MPCAEVFVQLKYSRRRESFAVGHFGHKVGIWKSANSYTERNHFSRCVFFERRRLSNENYKRISCYSFNEYTMVCC